MMTASDIFEPRPLFEIGGAQLIFGGTRLPNGQVVSRKPIVNSALTSDRKPRVCRGAGPEFAISAGSPFPIAAEPWSQRLGAQFGSDLVQGRHPSKISGKLRSRSGASPYQCTVMTKIKIFVPYFKSSIVPL
jgi:hypothetical protein